MELIHTPGSEVALIQIEPGLQGFSAAHFERMHGLLLRAADNVEIKALVLRGDSTTFISGASMAMLADLRDCSRANRALVLDKSINVIRAIKSAPFYVVCLVEGLVAGAGVEIMLACDRTYFAPSARLNWSYGRLNLIPDMGGLWLANGIVSTGVALDLLLESPTLPSSRLLELRLGRELPPKLEGDFDVKQWHLELRPLLRNERDLIGCAKSLTWQVQKPAFDAHIHKVIEQMTGLLDSPNFMTMLHRTRNLQQMKTQTTGL